jgi:hypothetical protein
VPPEEFYWILLVVEVLLLVVVVAGIGRAQLLDDVFFSVNVMLKIFVEYRSGFPVHASVLGFYVQRW